MIIGDHKSRKVFINGKELLPEKSQAVYNHSPDGYAWGYNGSGPAQLALAIMLEFIDDEKEAIKLYQAFKRDIIAGLNQEAGFVINLEDVKQWIKEKTKAG